MIDLVINEYGYRKEDRHKCSYRVKVALTGIDWQICGRYKTWEDL